jgi:hypothetical protein
VNRTYWPLLVGAGAILGAIGYAAAMAHAAARLAEPAPGEPPATADADGAAADPPASPSGFFAPGP